MEVLAIIGLLVGVGYGMDNDWKVAKAYHSYENCRVDNPKVQNTMTSWQYDPCNLAAYQVKNLTEEK
jgi:hypothetical protein